MVHANAPVCLTVTYTVELSSLGHAAQVRKQYASITGGGQIQMFHWRRTPFSTAVRLPVFTAVTAESGLLGSGVNGQVLRYAACVETWHKCCVVALHCCCAYGVTHLLPVQTCLMHRVSFSHVHLTLGPFLLLTVKPASSYTNCMTRSGVTSYWHRSINQDSRFARTGLPM